MSGLELVAVVACVAAVCSAYRDGSELVQQIKAKRRAKRAQLQEATLPNSSTQELENSLNRGEGVVRSQYDRDFKRFGASFATGDQIARDALRDVIIHLQSQIISNLKIQWQQDTYVNFSALQDVSDQDQDRTILILIQLQQRILLSAPIEDLRPAPLFAPNPLSTFDQQTQMQGFRPPLTSSSLEPTVVFPAPPAYRPSTSNSQSLATDIKHEEKAQSGTSRFWTRKRIKEDQKSQKPTVPSLSESSQSKGVSAIEPLHGRPSAVANVTNIPPRLAPVSIANNVALGIEPDSPEFNPWTVPRQPSPSPTRRNSLSSGSQFSRHQIPISMLDIKPSTLSMTGQSISVKDLLPGENNQYAGFCKGAWRLQIGDKKRAMGERQRPGGIYSANSYWKCSKCKFEGRMVMLDKKRKGFDTRVWMTEDEGVQFRWEFLFKSHIESKDSTPNPLQSTFGCIFCCVEGRGTPTFGGINSFMTHLQEHRDRLPTGEVLYRMNCLVGKRAQPDEDFEINLISKVVEEI